MISPIQESACHYLFGKEASEVFNLSKFSEEFINQSLETMMRVNIAFLSRKENDGFSLLDPVAFNQQCHLYALFAAKVRNHYKEKSIEEKLAKTHENRFLHLSFLLSYHFLNDRQQLLCNAIQLASNKKEIELPANQKLFNDFVKDSEGILIRTTRQSLNEVFERYIKEAFCEAKEKSLLHKELYHLSLENLHLSTNRGNSTNHHSNPMLFTLPKLAGVAYLMNEKIPFIIKSQVITKEGTAGTFVYQSAPIKENESVLVFETIISEQLSRDQFEETARRCHNYFFRNISNKNRHKEKSCLFCKVDNIDLEPYRKNFEKVTKSIEKTLYALGADFVKETQPSFVRFFKDHEVKYPVLTETFQSAISNINELGLSAKKSIAFTMNHVYVDDAQHALQPELRMNSSPEAYLKKRGFL